MSATIYVHPATLHDPRRLAILQALTGRVAISVGPVAHLVQRFHAIPIHRARSPRNDD